MYKIHVCACFKQGIWADRLHFQSFETLIFHDTATISLQVYTFGVEFHRWMNTRTMQPD